MNNTRAIGSPGFSSSGGGNTMRDNFGNTFTHLDLENYVDANGNNVPMSNKRFKKDLIYLTVDGTFRYERQMQPSSEYRSIADTVIDIHVVAPGGHPQGGGGTDSPGGPGNQAGLGWFRHQLPDPRPKLSSNRSPTWRVRTSAPGRFK